jgi:hypothetical protein
VNNNIKRRAAAINPINPINPINHINHINAALAASTPRSGIQATNPEQNLQMSVGFPTFADVLWRGVRTGWGQGVFVLPSGVRTPRLFQSLYMENSVEKTARPSFFWLVTEPGRALTELGMSYSYNSLLHRAKSAGDGHPVVILPGFMSTKTSTTMLRNHVQRLGYTAFDWGLGRNYGKVEYMGLMLETLDELYQSHGQKISLIGWSLGGVFARQLAKERSDIVRQVITLGSPFRDITKPNNIEWLYTMISGGKKAKHTNKALLDDMPLPAPVPTTAIYSKEDGIVPWQMCMEASEDELHQNIQVRGSHIGLGMNACVLGIIEDRLQYSRENWRYFKPKGLLNNVLCYPSL